MLSWMIGLSNSTFFHLKKDLKFCLSIFTVFNPKKGGGGGICPQLLRTLTVAFWTQLGVYNLRVFFIFGVYDDFRKKNWGVIKFFFSKNSRSKFFFSKNSRSKKIYFVNFWSFFKTNHVLWERFEFRMIPAFIWYIYCLCRWKSVNFQKY